MTKDHQSASHKAVREPPTDDEKAAQLAETRVADAAQAAAETLGQEGAGNPLREPVDIGKDDRGLDRDVHLDPADNQLRTFVSNNTDGSKDPDTGEKATPKAEED